LILGGFYKLALPDFEIIFE